MSQVTMRFGLVQGCPKSLTFFTTSVDSLEVALCCAAKQELTSGAAQQSPVTFRMPPVLAAFPLCFPRMGNPIKHVVEPNDTLPDDAVPVLLKGSHHNGSSPFSQQVQTTCKGPHPKKILARLLRGPPRYRGFLRPLPLLEWQRYYIISCAIHRSIMHSSSATSDNPLL